MVKEKGIGIGDKNMSIIENLTASLNDKVANIGIGLGDSKYHNNKILYAAIRFLNTVKKNIFIKISLFGHKESIDLISNNSSYEKYKEDILLVDTNEPENELIDTLDSYEISCIVRGSLSSSKFLSLIKEKYKTPQINRLALLETINGFQFFFGPVGIDECKDLESKIKYINEALNQLHFLRINPSISILSGGRMDDYERDIRVKKTIDDANEIIKCFKDIDSNLNINHNEILIEESIERKSNLIIAPDGISGNLIYRTLVHLGGGKAYGAIYMGLEKAIIDTSRVGNLSEIYGALILALTLS